MTSHILHSYKSRIAILTAILFFIINITKSQTLTNANCGPVTGKVLTYITGDYTSEQGPGGNQYWDFGFLQQSAEKAITSYTYIPLSLAVSAPGFTAATGAYRSNGTDNFYNNSNSGLSYYGSVAPNSNTLTYGSPELLLQFPCSMSNSFSSTWNSTLQTTNSLVSSSGTSTLEADGTGTLVSPCATYTGCVRLHRLSNKTTTTGTPGKFNTVNEDSYLWYCPGVQGQVLSVNTFTNVDYLPFVDIFNTTYSKYTVFYNDPVNALGIKNLTTQNSLALDFENPVQNQLNLRLKGEFSYLYITDLAGKEVFKKSISENKLDIDVSGLPNSLYIVRVVSANGFSLSKKMMIAR